MARPTEAPEIAPLRPLRVGVLVDLEKDERAGGQVKCWERLAEAAVSCADQVDLTVHFLGPKRRVTPLSKNVRFVEMPPVLGTRRLLILEQGGGHTDLAPYHRHLARALDGYDVFHATDFFSFGRTAARVARRQGRPLVYSAHTDLPAFTSVYTGEIVRRLFGRTPITSLLLGPLRVQDRTARVMRQRLRRGLSHCQHLLISNQEDAQVFAELGGPKQVSLLRRGIDITRFDPARRDRARLRETFGIDPERPVILFVGRVDETKSVLTLAKAVARLRDNDPRAHALFVGRGSQEGEVRRILGDRVTLAGPRRQEDLAWIYPSADLFAFPSRCEMAPNAVLEAKASGLPVVVASVHGGGQFVAQPGRDGIVMESDEAEAWSATLQGLLDDPARRGTMSAAARRWAVECCPTWREVLTEDLLPVWRRVASGTTAA